MADYTPTFDPANEDAAIDLAMKVYLEARRDGYGEIAAARIVNSSAKEIDRFIRMNPAFADAVEEAKAESLERVAAKVMETAQQGDFQAGKFVLEAHPDLPNKWIKPDREMVLRLGQPEEIDVNALHARLKAIEAGEIIDAGSEEESDDEAPSI